MNFYETSAKLDQGINELMNYLMEAVYNKMYKNKEMIDDRKSVAITNNNVNRGTVKKNNECKC